MTLEEIRLRRLSAQHLLTPSDTQTVLRDLCGVQAQFLSNAVHSLKIRCGDQNLGPGLVKNWTLRGTVHVFSEADLPLFLSPENYRRNQWDIPTWWNQRPDWALTAQRQGYFSDLILAALADGPQTREELKAVCRAHGMTDSEESSMFHPWGGGIRELCERGFLNQAVQEKKAFCLAPEVQPLPRKGAELELARRYFTHFGPATVKDAAYFFGTTQAAVKAWLKELPVQAFQTEGKTFYFLDEIAPERSMPDCLFLAGFDQLMLGYEKTESLFLPKEHLRGIFNLAGIVHPAVLVDGRVVGKWKHKNGKLTVTLFEAADRARISGAAEVLWDGLKDISFE